MELEAVALREHQFDDIERQQGGDDEELQQERSTGVASVGDEEEGTVAMGGKDASDDSDEQQAHPGAGEAQPHAEEEKTGENQKEKGVLFHREYDDGGGTEQSVEGHHLKRGPAGELSAEVKGEEERSDDGDSQRVGGEPALKRPHGRDGGVASAVERDQV